ncbi:hypothetical protein AB6A40_000119 [Gnathostoma spinigerum]|uniref:Vacuolar ATPase assembly protein VMA22 n=1 Tax=Gnathostoma spinigerum TaxID=75299 RepID=A0ABD6EAT1_9BILA
MDDKVDEVVGKLNNVSLDKLSSAVEFIRLSAELEAVLEQYRLNLSRTKNIIGVSNANAILVDNREMQPSVRFIIGPSNEISMISSAEMEDRSKSVRRRKEDKMHGSVENENERSKDTVDHSSFRPFGILEPSSAKAARRNIARALEIICEMATLKCQMNREQREYIKLKGELSSEVKELS